MSTVLLTSAGGLSQVSVIKHLRTLPEVTRIVGYDGARYYGASASLLDGTIDRLTDHGCEVVLPCGDQDAIALNPALSPICDKLLLLRGLRELRCCPAFTDEEWVKPRIGSGSRFGAKVVDLRMEYLPGRDWSIDVIASKGLPYAVVCRERLRTKGASMHGAVRDVKRVRQWATAVSNLLGLSGIFNVQMKEDRDGMPKVYEVNPRIAGSIMLSVYAGVDLLRMEIRRQLGLDFSDLNTIPRDGATMHRYYSEAFSG